MNDGIIICMNSVILNRVNINKFCIVGTSVNILHDTKMRRTVSLEEAH